MSRSTRGPRIVLAIGDVGAGHRSAAVALAAAIQERFGERVNVHIENLFDIVDPLPFGDSNRAQRWVARSGKLGALVNDGFWHFGNTVPGQAVVSAYLRLRVRTAYFRRLETLAPDAVVSMHPYVAELVAHLVAAGAPFRHAVVVTDLGTLQRSWAVPTAERVVFPAPPARRTLIRYGVPAERLVGPLFPLAAALRSPVGGGDPLAELGLGGTSPSVIITGGGNAMSSLAPAAMVLAERYPYRVVIVCGKDERLRAALEDRLAARPNVRVVGFVTNLVQLMGAATVVVAKPGPATVLELELLGRRVLLVGDHGPQEHGNVTYALENPRFRRFSGPAAGLADAVQGLIEAPLPDFAPRRRPDEALEIADVLSALWS